MGHFSDKQEEVKATLEFHRIANLPRRSMLAEELEALRVRLTDALRRPGGTMSLRVKQAHALAEIGLYGGLVGVMRVGSGKTLVTLLAPAMLHPEPRRPLLVTKASLVEKTKQDFARMKEHWLLPTNMQYVSYEFLGRVSGSDFLEKTCRPDMLILDECHLAKNKKAGVTRRLARYMADNPKTKVVDLSGTFFKASLKDAAHLIRWALKDAAPVPVHETEVDAWADALDAASRVNPLQRHKPGALLTLATPEDWQPRKEGEHVTPIIAARRGFQRRLIETPGVVATGDEQVACSLDIIGKRFDPNAATEANFAHLRRTWRTPDDWQLMQAVEVWACARQLALGFHYTWLEAARWKAWLQETLQNESNRISPIAKTILRAFAHTSVNETEISSVLAHLKGRGTEPSGTDTRSRQPNISGSSTSSEGSATFAGNEGLVKRLSTLITTTGLGRYVASSAPRVIGLSECLEILSKAFPQLFDTLKAAERAARPPEEWRVARKIWNQFVRETLKNSRKLDTPYQVELACKEGALDATAFNGWNEVRSSFTPRSSAVWHDDTAILICQQWSERNDGIVWSEHSEFARELSRRSKLPYFGRDGLDANGQDLNVVAHEVLTGKRKPFPLIASIKANSTGRNLQGWSENLITSIPTEASVWEQLLGRTHRDGQEADEVHVTTLFGCFEHIDGWLKAVELAEATQDTEGSSQKLCMATCTVPAVAFLPGPRWQRTPPEKEGLLGEVA